MSDTEEHLPEGFSRSLYDKAAQAMADATGKKQGPSEASLSTALALIDELTVSWPHARVVIGWIAIPALNWRPETSADIAGIKSFVSAGGAPPGFYHAWIDLGDGRIFDVSGPGRLSDKERSTSIGHKLGVLRHWDELVSHDYGLLYTGILGDADDIAKFSDQLVADRSEGAGSEAGPGPFVSTGSIPGLTSSPKHRLLDGVIGHVRRLRRPFRRRRRLFSAWRRWRVVSTAHEGRTRADFVIWRRWDRYRHFVLLGRVARRRWATAAESVADVEYLKKLHDLHVVPGGAEGGQDALLVDIFFGHRPYDNYKRQFVDSEGRRHKEMGSYREQGARLLYVRQDDGRVECRLVPARTQLSSRKQLDYLRRPLRLHPRTLRNPSTIKRHLRWLTVYMGHTSLDGAVSLYPWYTLKGAWQRRTLLWLLCGWQPVREDAAEWPLVWKGTFALFKFVVTIGLSGVLLWGIDHLRHPATDMVTPAVHRVESALVELSRKVERVDREMVSNRREDRLREDIKAFQEASAFGSKPTWGILSSPGPDTPPKRPDPAVLQNGKTKH